MDVTTLPTIPQFFAGRDIFITGGSGFMGKALIEKIFFACPAVGNIYVLLRPKKKRTIEERLALLKEESVFERIRKDKNKIGQLDKLIPVAGDVSVLNMGISEEDIRAMENVSIVFHVAASVRFDDPLKDAILMNARGTREVCRFAERLQNLKVMMHVSTSYCNPDWHDIEEKIYPPYADWKKAIKIAETYDQELLDILAPKYTSFQPNTYTFTKSLAEQIINDFKEKLPLIIFRPSIVISAVSEPMPGWIDNFNGPVGLLVGCGLGINRTLYSNPDNVADYTPVDIAVRAMLSAVWKRGTQEPIDPLPIYNCSTSDVRPTTFDEVVALGKDLAPQWPFDKTLWYPGGNVTNWKMYNYIKVILLHVLPAIIIDTAFKISGKKPFILKLQRRIYQANQALAYFVLNTWTFQNKNLYSLNEGLQDCDLKLFQFNYEINTDVKNYFGMAILGTRRYLMHEKDEDLPAARARFQRMKYLDWAVKTVVYSLFAYFLITRLDIIPLLVRLTNQNIAQNVN
ncbi:putative fatty acyl-CoA reductase CG5065 [Lutzomyia longipalpis]|uniref:putative fatty acyl-CoA reductase CG5065 n=1 Tax=Lutzomyia longipalpis TaxID=7200 RepID=UPI0024834FD9|nr:putative fatty acyl-CoA reductase CG5065 [Lutzomyia longipalpis]XP_055680431.1 putative fatty acyl-CoA reductase CG5065 [Lutzomyia longipalpis]